MPEVSVILPVYNRAAVLGRAIKSVLVQDFHDFELVVVDDGSDDGSGEVARSFDDQRLRLITRASNGGVSSARNEGLRHSSGSLICFLDSDDIYLPHKLSVVADRFQREQDLGLLVDSFCTVYGSARRRSERDRCNPVITSSGPFVEALFKRQLWKATPAISVRREIAFAAGLFDEALRRREDFDFLLRAASLTRCASTDERLWIKCRSRASLSAPLDTFVPATIELLKRHPQYAADRRYRSGLRRDLLRHALRLILKGRLPLLYRDVRDLIAMSPRAGHPRC